MKQNIKRFVVLMLLLTFTINVVNSPERINAQESRSSKSILLLGVDTGDLGRSDHGRSDVMMLLTVNSTTELITVTSIPRDAYVMIPGYYMDKINHAYAFGGPELSMQSVEQWFDIEIDNYIAVNMAGLKEVIDAVGGIDVVSPTSFSISGYDFSAGEAITLDGDKALAYVRERYTSGGDYGRQERQRQVVQGLISKMASFDSILNFQSVYSTMSSNIETDLGFLNLVQLFADYRQLANSVEFYQLSGGGTMIDGIYYDLIYDDSYNEVMANLSSQLN
ncbi:LCP family protein [Fundicoccus sp. Sow4_F4]|uniref:LCP family protein n=1 Tax=Fundicoccus sp. Sow4_F4 TaxID=3438783 RepID=UPI003F8E7284